MSTLPSLPIDQSTDWMGNPAPSINTWSSWGPGSNEPVFGDMMSQGSMRNASFMDHQPAPSSQPFFTQPISNSSPELSQIEPRSNPRSDVSSVSNGSPETRSLDDDLLALDTINPKNSPSSKSPANRVSPPSDHSSKVKKRTLNTLAARRYRQKRVDQMQGLETVLKDTESERDELKIKVARLEAEVEVLRRLIESGNSNSSSEKS
ncbi:uncharacterized protein LY89DRAFT_690204 [Mollisia scopiformis]|uniref:BZIP domain-containing protein n=1 Tax=Mollisia scopiformis TaxID=149040 RepID=A0A132BBJ0_MOLSC|nr:uncharacterized protein LY89DRAFT_690204 [Mollisia scopiformis]KUJ09792.1 hypothetical protein LY89DRAFT_690204 [Mollisia scopiformis]